MRFDEAIKLCDEAIGLFLEYRDVHGYEEGGARLAALGEIREGQAARLSLKDESLSVLAEKWNNPPYPTYAQLAREYGVTRQRIHQRFEVARTNGLPILTPWERSLKKRQEKHEAALALRPKCATCGRPVQKNTKQRGNGLYYCATHRLDDPETRAAHYKRTQENHYLRLAADPTYAERLREYQLRYQAKKRTPNEEG